LLGAAVFWNRLRCSGYRLAKPPAVRALLMDCREFRSKHVAYVDDLLAAVDMDAVRAHLERCTTCAHQDTAVRRSLMLVRNLPSIEPSPDFMIRLNARLSEIGPRPAYVAARTSLFFSVPAMGTFAAVAAGIGVIAVLSFRTSHYVAPVQEANAHITNAPIPDAPISADVDLTPAAMPSANGGASVTPMANAAYVAAVPTGMAIWPAMLMIGEAPVRFATMELQQPDGR
jgi:hypothetical protein